MEERKKVPLAFIFYEFVLDAYPDYSPVSHETIRLWLREYFLLHGISPVQTDYSDTCSDLKKQIESAKLIVQHMLGGVSTSSGDVQAKRALLDSYTSLLHHHRVLATIEQREYKNCIEASYSFFSQHILGRNWTDVTERVILDLELLEEMDIACGYQMGKLIPHWGQTAQPGKTYFYQNISHDIFGILNASTSARPVYVKDDTVEGDKNADHVCSYLTDYVERIIPESVRRLKTYLYSAPYFKTKYVIWWAVEMIAARRFKCVRFSYMVPGHTKFQPDSMFSEISHRFYKSEVHNTLELVDVVGTCNVIPIHFRPLSVRQWRSRLGEKNCEIPKITE